MYKKVLLVLIGIVLVGAVVLWRDRSTNEPQPTQSPAPTAQVNQYKDLIVLTRPLPNATISSPVVIEGRARGTWFFEASFPIMIVDWDGRIIGQGIAQAQSEWMTADYVPFKAMLTYTDPTYRNNGWIILQKDNPSGLPEHDDAFEVPIFFAL